MPFVDTNELEVKELLPGWKGRFFHSESMTLAYYVVAAGSAIQEHSHPNDEVWNVLEGTLEVTIDEDTQVAKAGHAAVVPPNTPHSVKAVTDARAIVVDHPVRRSVGGVDL